MSIAIIQLGVLICGVILTAMEFHLSFYGGMGLFFIGYALLPITS